MRGAVAAGHPLTTDAGARVLEEGGNAVDACVAAAFASWVTESPLTGPGAGGFALVHPADGRPERLADFFVATPGRGLEQTPDAAMHAIDVEFGGDAQASQIFRIGEPSCAVPGAAAGLEALHRAYGALPWPELLAPAVELARRGVEVTRPQAHLHAILDLILRHTDEGRRLYSGPDGSRLVAGDILRLPDLADTLEQIAADGAAALYEGELAAAIVRTVGAGGGNLTRADLSAYRVKWRRPLRVPYGGLRGRLESPAVIGRHPDPVRPRAARPAGRMRSADDVAARVALIEVMREQTRARDDRFGAGLRRGGLARELLGEARLGAAVERIHATAPGLPEHTPYGGTTHISVVDGAGNAVALTCSTGSGSGVIVPGTGIHLNNMLGEYDLASGGSPLPGRRLTSMMSPTIVLGAERRPRLVVGSAGSVRLRGAIMQTIVNVVTHGLPVADAIDRPRLHVDEPHVHCEGGFEPAVLDRLEALGYDVVRWRRRNLFFGGTNGVEMLPDGSLAAAGDPRRGGAGVVVGL